MGITRFQDKINKIRSLISVNDSADDYSPVNKLGINRMLDEPIKQGDIGDCWFIAGLLSLNSTEKGRQIIKDAIIPNKDGTVSVKFGFCPDKEYIVTPEKIKEYDIESGGKIGYSSGDNDLLVLELAYEKFRQEVRGIKNLAGGKPHEVWLYMDPSHLQSTYFTSEGSTAPEVPKILQKIHDGNGNSIGAFSLGDITGKTSPHSAKLVDESIFSYNKEGHAFAITNVSSDTVTFVNPWNSSTEYKMTWEEFEKLDPGRMFYYSLE